MLGKQLRYFYRDTNKWSLFTVIILLLITVPIATIFFKLLSGPGESWSHIVDNILLDYTLNSIWLILGSCILTFVFGVSSAWIVSRYHLPFIKTMEWFLILPLAIPSYITAYAYAGFFNYGGLFEMFQKLFHLPVTKFNITNIYGLVFVLGISLFPYVYVSTRAFFLYQSGRLIEVSKTLGVSRTKTFFKIILPMARPAIIAGIILVLMEVLNDYGAAKYYGVNTFTTGIFRAWFSLEEFNTSIYLSALLLVIVFALIFLERKNRGSKGYETNTKSARKLLKITPSKSKQFYLLFIVSIPLFFGFVLPVLQLIYWCVLTYTEVLSLDFFNIAFQSFAIAFLTASVTVILAVCLIYFPLWNRIRAIKQSPKLAILGYAVPGSVIAIGVMVPTLFFDKSLASLFKTYFDTEIGLFFNATIIVLVYAYMIRFLAVAYNPIESNKIKIGNHLFETSKLLGLSNVKSFFKIDFPLLKPGLFSAFILVFVDTMKELPLTLILKPYNINTLAVNAYEYASDELIMQASTPSLCIILTGVIPIIILNKFILNDK